MLLGGDTIEIRRGLQLITASHVVGDLYYMFWLFSVNRSGAFCWRSVDVSRITS